MRRSVVPGRVAMRAVVGIGSREAYLFWRLDARDWGLVWRLQVRGWKLKDDAGDVGTRAGSGGKIRT